MNLPSVFVCFLIVVPVFGQGFEGLEFPTLTASERQELQEYAESTRAEIESVLRQAQEQDYSTAFVTYRRGASRVLAHSTKSEPRVELLSRIAIEQGVSLCDFALETSNPGASGYALEKAFQRAVEYLPNGGATLVESVYSTAPYLEFSKVRLGDCVQFLGIVPEKVTREKLARTCAMQFMSVVSRPGVSRKPIAETVLEMDDALRGKTRVLDWQHAVVRWNVILNGRTRASGTWGSE